MKTAYCRTYITCHDIEVSLDTCMHHHCYPLLLSISALLTSLIADQFVSPSSSTSSTIFPHSRSDSYFTSTLTLQPLNTAY